MKIKFKIKSISDSEESRVFLTTTSFFTRNFMHFYFIHDLSEDVNKVCIIKGHVQEKDSGDVYVIEGAEARIYPKEYRKSPTLGALSSSYIRGGYETDFSLSDFISDEELPNYHGLSHIFDVQVREALKTGKIEKQEETEEEIKEKEEASKNYMGALKRLFKL